MSHENNGFDAWGGYMNAKVTKLEEQYSAASNPFRKSNLFEGISIFVNGLTNPSADELKRIMMVHGGTFHHYERNSTTYIIAANLPDVKVRNMNTSKHISAQWVVDSIKEGRILDYTHYLLYTNHKSTQPKLMFSKAKNERKDESQLESAELWEQQMAVGNATDESSLKSTSEQNLSTAGNTAASSMAIDAGNSPKEEDPSTTSNLSKQEEQIPTVTVKTEAKSFTSSSSSTSNVARTACDPKFLSEFYNNSRLHHIATLGAGFKQYVSTLREQHAGAGFPARTQLRQLLQAQSVPEQKIKLPTCIMHIDMDCFFVSVGLRNHPELRGYPIAVTHSKGGAAASNVPVHPDADRMAERELFAKRFEHHLHDNIRSDKVRQGFDSKMSLSEIASCSYEARAAGIKNGMFVGHALKLCPELKTLPYDFEGYKEVAYTLYDTVAQYTLNIEAVSCDEMFVDLSDVLGELNLAPMDFVRAVREEVRRKTGCPCSAGVGANKLQARMATKRAKPDGQYQLEVGDAKAYMADVPIRELPGVGSSTAYTFEQEKLHTCGDLQQLSLSRIQMLVGKKFGETLHQFCRGIDNRGLTYEQLRKSVSAEVNYGIRFTENSELEQFLRQLCTEVHTRLTDIKRKTKCVTLKLMKRAKEAPVETSKFMGHGVCDYITKSVSLSEFTTDLEVITRTVLTTMKAQAIPPHELRGIGIQLTKLDDPNEGKERKENVIKSLFSKVVEKQKSAVETLKRSPPTVKETNIEALHKPNKKPKRGRPPGSVAAASSTSNESKSQADIMRMLQNVAAKQAATTNNASAELPANIDPEVFFALPPEIREDILRTHAPKRININEMDPPTSVVPAEEKHVPKEYETQEVSSVDAELLQSLPPQLRKDSETQMQMNKTKFESGDPSTSCTKEVATVSSCNIFTEKNCLELLLQWVKGSDEPMSYDIALLSENAVEIVRAKHFQLLYEPLRYLCKIINNYRDTKADCAWHAAYITIVTAVQLAMSEVYQGRKLYLGEVLHCKPCAAKL